MTKRAVITDHGFPCIDIQRRIVESAGFVLDEIQPICTTEDDIIRLRALEKVNLAGAIVGKALYEGRVNLHELLAAART